MTAPDNPAVLAAADVVAGYPGRDPVLAGASLVLTPGSRLAVLGANGSGKTTLMRVLAGSHRPASGEVRFAGEALRERPTALRRHRSRVQLVLQDPDDQLFSADVTQDVSFGPMNLRLSLDQVRDRVAEALQLLGIDHLAMRATHQLSYGERKRVAIAGAVALRPSVLLLDEPTAGLDPCGVAGMIRTLTSLEARGTTVALATHDVDLALAWADEVAVVRSGTVVQGAAMTLLDDPDLLSQAGLRRPWPLELAGRLGMPRHWRTLDDGAAALGRRPVNESL